MNIEIKNSTTSAMIKTLGAELSSFKRADGVELLWQGDSTYWSGQAPVLFPIVGALRNGKTIIEGKIHEINKHGFARNNEFVVVEQTEDSVTMLLESTENTKEMYPYDFQLYVSYTVKECAIETRFLVKNVGDKAMPYVVGGHPAYNVPMVSGAQYEEYELVFERKEDVACPYVDMDKAMLDDSRVAYELKKSRTIPLRHNLFYHDALVFDELASNTVSIIHKKTGHGLEMDISEFPMLGVWSSMNDGPYVALEPWVGCASRFCESDEFIEKKNMQILEKGAEQIYSFTTRYFK